MPSFASWTHFLVPHTQSLDQVNMCEWAKKREIQLKWYKVTEGISNGCWKLFSCFSRSNLLSLSLSISPLFLSILYNSLLFFGISEYYAPFSQSHEHRVNRLTIIDSVPQKCSAGWKIGMFQLNVIIIFGWFHLCSDFTTE